MLSARRARIEKSSIGWIMISLIALCTDPILRDRVAALPRRFYTRLEGHREMNRRHIHPIFSSQSLTAIISSYDRIKDYFRDIVLISPTNKAFSSIKASSKLALGLHNLALQYRVPDDIFAIRRAHSSQPDTLRGLC